MNNISYVVLLNFILLFLDDILKKNIFFYLDNVTYYKNITSFALMMIYNTTIIIKCDKKKEKEYYLNLII